MLESKKGKPWNVQGANFADNIRYAGLWAEPDLKRS